MQHGTNEGGLLLETNQRRDIFIHTQPGDNVSVRLFSMRCQEAQTQTLLNQDFAAHYLAGRLLSWLQDIPAVPANLDQLSRTLHSLLDVWAHQAHMLLSKLAIPAETPELVREVLEELRDTTGSETVFFCGRIDARKLPTQSDTPLSTQALFCWMGNVTARLSLSSNRCIILGDQNNDKNRWSTIHSRRGQVTIWSDSLPTIERLIIYTDGLDTVGEKLALATDEEWQAHAQSLQLLPQNDDMTALEFCWLHEKKGPAA
jgi:hypothetical protein